MTKKIYPLGGLGNQLFALAAAYVMSGPSEEPVILDGSLTQYGSNLSRHFELSEIRLPKSDFITFQNTKYSQSNRIRELIRRKLRLSRPSFVSPLIDCTTTNPDFTELLALKNLHSSFSGQFQNFEIVEAAVQFGFPTTLNPTDPSDSFCRFQSELNSGFHAMHIRGGDFTKQRKIYPIIPEEYYLAALSKSKNLPMVIFTDDLEFVNRNYAEVLAKATRIIGVREKLSSVETIALMSLAQVLTTANSTFSTWAAWFAAQHSAEIHTVTPHHFDNWIDTLPKNWERYELFPMI